MKTTHTDLRDALVLATDKHDAVAAWDAKPVDPTWDADHPRRIKAREDRATAFADLKKKLDAGVADFNQELSSADHAKQQLTRAAERGH